jgi:ribonucleoside-diphosphate reductase alpha chain
MGHVKMMAAVQPFLSGAISKTVNLPEEATVEDLEQLHIESWKMGLKAVAIYRDNCKVGQPLSMAKKEGSEITAIVSEPVAAESTNDKFIVTGAVMKELPRVRQAKTFAFRVSDSKGFFTVGEYDDGTPGELFVTIAKQGSTLAGIMDALAISVSHGLKYGVPLKAYVKSLTNMSFTPAGITDDETIRTASSIVDYIFRRMALSYLSFDDQIELGLRSIDDLPETQTSFLDSTEKEEVVLNPAVGKIEKVQEVVFSTPNEDKNINYKAKPVNDNTAPLCYNCGNQTQRSGTCYVCSSCGSTTGCS